MTEPIYSYVKGQGWVVCPPGLTFAMACGTVVRIELRKPEIGEFYTWVVPDDGPEWVNPDSTPNQERMKKDYEQEHYSGTGKFDGYEPSTPGFTWITFAKVS